MINIFRLILYLKMHARFCNSCYSSTNIVYSYRNFICLKCKIIVKKCDTCGLYCGNTCLDLFDKVLTLE